MSGPETRLVGRIKRAIHFQHPHAWVLKVVGHPAQESGVPDLLVCVDGRLIGLEVKHQKAGESSDRARARASALQAAQIERIIRSGGWAAVVLDEHEALEVIAQALG